MCSIVAMIAFKGKKDTLYIDFTYNFTSENRITAPIGAWFETLEEMDEEGKFDVEIEIRSLKQTIPLQ